MKTNQIVQVFQYPDKVGYEGKGILLERTFQNDRLEIWILKLLRTGEETQRIFYK